MPICRSSSAIRVVIFSKPSSPNSSCSLFSNSSAIASHSSGGDEIAQHGKELGILRAAWLLPSNRHAERVVGEQPVVALADAIRLPLAGDIFISAFGVRQRGIVEAFGVLGRLGHDRIGALDPRALIALQRLQ